MQIPAADPVDPRLVNRLRAAGCVFAEDEARLLTAAARTAPELGEFVSRRLSGVPLEHVVGWAEFAGLRIAVADGVFVPRRRTELLARHAAELAAEVSDHRATVVDLCCGAGAIAAVVSRDVPTADVHAADIDPAAVACARRNLTGAVYEGDLFDALPPALRGRIDVLVANIPYVPTEAISTMPPEARNFEARLALDGGADGLDVLRRITAQLHEWLAPEGWLLIETSEVQAATAQAEFAAAHLAAWVESDDDLGATVVIGNLAR